jgi:hypothetical protein
VCERVHFTSEAICFERRGRDCFAALAPVPGPIGNDKLCHCERAYFASEAICSECRGGDCLGGRACLLRNCLFRKRSGEARMKPDHTGTSSPRPGFWRSTRARLHPDFPTHTIFPAAPLRILELARFFPKEARSSAVDLLSMTFHLGVFIPC